MWRTISDYKGLRNMSKKQTNFLKENEDRIREEFAKLMQKPIPEIKQKEIIYEFWVTLPKSKKDVKLMATNEEEAIKECNTKFGKFSDKNMYSIFKTFLKYV